MPRLTTSRPRSGSCMWDRTSSTCWGVGLMAWMLPGLVIGPRRFNRWRVEVTARRATIKPSVLILVGQMAIARFLGPGPLEERVGRTFGEKPVIVPLPHPSGQSRWLNAVANRARLDNALALIAKLRADALG